MTSCRSLNSVRTGRIACCLMVLTLLVLASVAGFGQEGNSPSGAVETDAAVIERLPLVLRDPQSYQTPLSLKPVASLDLVAQADGIVKSIQVELGGSIAAQAEAVRLDSTEQQLLVDRAKAALKAAQAGSGEQADALLEVARLDVRIAEFRLEQTVVRAPNPGTVTAIHVEPGQYVRAGDPLVRVADLSKLAVELPVDRSASKVGDSLEIKIEDQTATGEIAGIQPLSPQFEPLRELFLSVANAVVTVENPGGKFSEGQTVYADLIPRAPVSEVPTIAVGSDAEGNRRVQVIREGFVRDVPVDLLGQAGHDYVFVSGRFGPTDEAVVKTSKELRDGMRVLPAAPAEADEGTGRDRSRPGNRRPASDF